MATHCLCACWNARHVVSGKAYLSHTVSSGHARADDTPVRGNLHVDSFRTAAQGGKSANPCHDRVRRGCYWTHVQRYRHGTHVQYRQVVNTC